MRVDRNSPPGDPVNMNNTRIIPPDPHEAIFRTTLRTGGHTLAIEYPEDLAGRPGPVWMFLHGIAVCASFWEPLMPAHFRDHEPWLSVSLPVHSPSSGPPGFSAGSVSPDLFNGLNEAVLDQIVPGREVIVVGHSTGGFAALCLALARPGQIRGVVSAGGFADGHWTGLEGDMQRMARREKLGAFGPQALRWTAWLTTRWPWLHVRLASRFAHDREAFLTDAPTKRALHHLRQAARRQNQDQLLAFFAGIRDVDIWSRIHEITCPVLVLDGTSDPVIPLEKTMRLARELPNARLLLYPAVGHMVMNERRERFWSDITAWRDTIITGGKS